MMLQILKENTFGIIGVNREYVDNGFTWIIASIFIALILNMRLIENAGFIVIIHKIITETHRDFKLPSVVWNSSLNSKILLILTKRHFGSVGSHWQCMYLFSRKLLKINIIEDYHLLMETHVDMVIHLAFNQQM